MRLRFGGIMGVCMLVAASLSASGCKEDWSARLGLRPLYNAVAHPFHPYPVERLEEELAADPPRFSFVVLGDTDLASGDLSRGGKTTRFDTIMDAVRSMRPEPRFVFHLGDVADDPGDTGAWEALIRKAFPFETGFVRGMPAEALRRRFLALPGERDVNDRRTEKAFLERFPRSSGRVPFSFSWEDVHFIALNSEAIDDGWLMKRFGYNRNQNRITGAQWKWLEEDLRRNQGKQIVVFIHKPFFSPVFSCHDGYGLDQYYVARERLIDLLEAYSVEVVFSGHEPIFSPARVGKTWYIITGGAGRKPRAPGRFGGFPHFLYVTIEPGGGMTVYCVDPERHAVEQRIAVGQARSRR